MSLTFRRAARADVLEVVRLLADDDFAAGRERFSGSVEDGYWRAFDAIDTDARQLLVVGEQDGQVVATLQLTFIPHLTYGGSERAQIEGVRVERSLRGTGIGGQLIEWAIDEARRRGCRLVQLTTNKQRTEARRFYERVGFVASHEGMKLDLHAGLQPQPEES